MVDNIFGQCAIPGLHGIFIAKALHMKGTCKKYDIEARRVLGFLGSD